MSEKCPTNACQSPLNILVTTAVYSQVWFRSILYLTQSDERHSRPMKKSTT